MARKKAAPPGPTHECGHELWLHSKRANNGEWRCHEAGCECKTTTLTPQ